MQKMASSKTCILFYFFLFISCYAFDSQTDKLSLLSFKEKITDDPLNAMSLWNDTINVCQWRGVACSTRRARVTMLTLPSQKLSGYLSPSIANLTFLRVIDLRGNNFRGKIPAEIGRLFRLESLFLTENDFGGEIPTNLSQCHRLRFINLNFNNLTGKIPGEIAGLQNLIAIHISANYLTGGIPPVLGNLSSLVNLSIAHNNLGGVIPGDLGRLFNLQFLQVGNNNLSGSLPPSIFNLSRISIFAVAVNHLVGNFPPNIGNYFPNLRQFLVGVNAFSGQIPPSLSNTSSLQIIDLPDNRFSGKVPFDLGRIESLVRLNVGRNLLGGVDANLHPNGLEFINSLTNCSKFEFLGIDSNRFSGQLPNTIANLSINMNKLLIGENSLSGEIPFGITNLINLNTLNVSWNEFNGPIIPNIGKLFNLRQLYMNENRFSGNIPSDIGNLTKMFELRLDRNKLENTIPSTLGNCQQLQLLNLSNNKLNGDIPVHVFTIKSLALSLNLGNNDLTGNLPLEIGNLLNLNEIDLSNNHILGNIPETLGQCSSLEHIYMQGNAINASIPISLNALKGLQDFDMSRNNLTGNIPYFFEDFVFLRYLNLSFNQFEGEVPKHGIFANKSGFSLYGNGELCGGNIELELPSCSIASGPVGPGSGKSNLKVVIGIVTGVSCFVVLIIVVVSCIVKKSKIAISFTWNSDFSYKELEKATNGFSIEKMVGSGSFAAVYKGYLAKNEKNIAVKVLKLHENGVSKIYMAECEALSNVRHRNLVKILGTCLDVDFQGRDFKAIVLEFVPNGTLEKFLHEENGDIFRRMSIAIDVACALEYLHYYCQIPIVHCDLKPSNVLLDGDYCARLSDFGLAKFLRKHAQGESSSIGIIGSIGYVAPEYGMGGAASISGDVYSFGILLLEMFTGKRPTHELFKDGLTLHNFAKNALYLDQIMDILDPKLLTLLNQDDDDEEDNGSTSIRIMEKEKIKECLVMVIRIGVVCSQGLPQERMNIKDANMNLKLIRELFLD